jgi:hypothetical protein
VFALVALPSLVGLARADTFTKANLPGDHPLVGTWELVFPPYYNCHERSEILANGTRRSQSGMERISSEYSVEEIALSQPHFFKWTDKVVSSNHRPDCSGGLTSVGDIVTWYIYVDVKGGQMYLCKTPSIKDTFAIFRRMAVGGI